MHVKKGDKVKVITGKDKGKEGVILAAFPKVKKHVKPNQLNPQGGIVSQEAAIHVSNVANRH
ncbi:Large ribosomal subunit protein uL24 OS=Lysinibacillus sphaericus CBAM5 OX=1400869 GN=rplX PE=3 SV=1 [Lysinibacillus sphaericus]